MKKKLILALSNEKDILELASFVQSLYLSEPTSELSILVFDKHYVQVSTFKFIANIYTIDEEVIFNLKNSPLFSDALAMNKLKLYIKGIMDQSWNQIINVGESFSNNYFLSYFSSPEKIGSRVGPNGSLILSNTWSKVLSSDSRNEIFPISKSEIIHRMCGLDVQVNSNGAIESSHDFDMIAEKNFNQIRSSKDSESLKIIGISLLKSNDGLEVDFESTIEIIETLEASPDFKTVLLLAGKSEEKALADKLNQSHSNELISINVDTTASHAVIKNLDAIISHPNEHSTSADLLGINLIQIDLPKIYNTSSFFSSDNYSIRSLPSKPYYNEVSFILNSYYHSDLPVESTAQLSKIYKTVNDGSFTFLTQIAGPIDIEKEIHYHLSREFISRILNGNKNVELIKNLKLNIDTKIIQDYVINVKTELTETVKLLLSTLRSSKLVNQSRENQVRFITYLDELLSISKKNTISSIPVEVFAIELEEYNTRTPQENITFIEQSLFKLKSDFQVMAGLLQELTEPSIEEQLPEKPMEL